MESPKSWMASDMIATLFVNNPPINSKIEKNKLSKNAIKIFFSLCTVSYLHHGNAKTVAPTAPE